MIQSKAAIQNCLQYLNYRKLYSEVDEFPSKTGNYFPDFFHRLTKFSIKTMENGT